MVLLNWRMQTCLLFSRLGAKIFINVLSRKETDKLDRLLQRNQINRRAPLLCGLYCLYILYIRGSSNDSSTRTIPENTNMYMFSFRSIFLHPDSHSVAFTKILSELNLANRLFKKNPTAGTQAEKNLKAPSVAQLKPEASICRPISCNDLVIGPFKLQKRKQLSLMQQARVKDLKDKQKY